MQIHRDAGYSKKGQLKIQQTAFMLVGLFIFFAMVAIVYFTISMKSLEGRAEDLREEEAKELARQLSGTPELAFTAGSGCSSCIDYDKARELSESLAYKKFWNLDYLVIERISPEPREDLVIIGNVEPTGTKIAFVALARWDRETQDYKYELGIIHALAKIPE
ncbi:MAG: hypothetical protein KJ600_01340 [Nanoarchaeota archaeon]|nr:hypothetical protein [Nanoarchaeota archaeon]MBU1103187.1 hypothetical protein [Nanoarchaeota archaeon]